MLPVWEHFTLGQIGAQDKETSKQGNKGENSVFLRSSASFPICPQTGMHPPAFTTPMVMVKFHFDQP